MQQPCIDTPVLPLLLEESMRKDTAGALQNNKQKSQNREQLERMGVADVPRTEQQTALSLSHQSPITNYLTRFYQAYSDAPDVNSLSFLRSCVPPAFLRKIDNVTTLIDALEQLNDSQEKQNDRPQSDTRAQEKKSLDESRSSHVSQETTGPQRRNHGGNRARRTAVDGGRGNYTWRPNGTRRGGRRATPP